MFAMGRYLTPDHIQGFGYEDMTYVNPGGEDYEESWWILLQSHHILVRQYEESLWILLILNVPMNVSESEGILDLRSMFLLTSSDGYFWPGSPLIVPETFFYDYAADS